MALAELIKTLGYYLDIILGSSEVSQTACLNIQQSIQQVDSLSAHRHHRCATAAIYAAAVIIILIQAVVVQLRRTQHGVGPSRAQAIA
ncbi:hypothetical protein [Pseudomonas sp. MWU13-2105]|uniref:hypothetical protein n=1 Tax=Pseudomonas sp. MWU13-2105 TaxID=2935074 RepID=UPI00200F1EAC|nr:hypothetical protein [Pseudomonas sp. MWU13-2105]